VELAVFGGSDRLGGHTSGLLTDEARGFQLIAIADLRQRLEAFAKTVGIHKTWQDPLSESYRRFAEDLPFLQPDPLIPYLLRACLGK
jgi:hypothetical protein